MSRACVGRGAGKSLRPRGGGEIGRAMEPHSRVARETGYIEGVQEFRVTDTTEPAAPTRCGAVHGSQARRAPRSPPSPRTSIPSHLVEGDRVIFSSRTKFPGNERRSAASSNGLINRHRGESPTAPHL